MGTNPSQGQGSDQSNQYGGYTGYTPPSPQDDPYGAFDKRGSGAQQSGADYQYGQYGQQQQQFSGTYEPPLSARMSGTGGAATVVERKDAALSYIFLFFSGLFYFFKDKTSRFVRFHAAQSTIFSGLVFIVYIVLQLLTHLPLLGFLLAPVIGCMTSVLLVLAGLVWLFLAVQSYRGGKFKLPFIGDYAESVVSRFTK